MMYENWIEMQIFFVQYSALKYVICKNGVCIVTKWNVVYESLEILWHNRHIDG